MSLPLLHAGRTNPGLSAALDLRFALDKSLTAYRGPTPSFSRASTGSYFDGSGVLRYANVNTILYSEEFGNAYWNATASSVTQNTINGPTGYATADSLFEASGVNYHGFFPASGVSVNIGQNYTLSVYVKKGNRRYFVIGYAFNAGLGSAVQFDLDTSTVAYSFANGGYGIVSSSATNVGNGWIRISAVLTSTTSTVYPVILNSDSLWTTGNIHQNTYSGDPTKFTYIWGAQLEASSTVGTYCPTTSSANSAPRFNHTFNGTSWVSRGLLVEEQRTNLCLYSNPYAAAADRWGSTFVSLTPNAVTSPDGTQNATSVVGVNTASFFQVYYYFNQPSGTYTQSFFLKSNGANIVSVYDYAGNVSVGWYDLVNGTSQAGSYGGVTYSATITNVGNGWYRCTVTNQSAVSMPWIHLRPVTAMGGTTNLSGNGVSGFYVYGVQGEAGSFATSLISTNGSATTRSADVCQITGSDFSGFWNGTEGTLVAEYDRLASVDANFSSGYPRIATAVKTSDTSRAVTLFASQSPAGEAFFVQDGTVQAWFSAGSIASANAPTKLSAAYKANDFAASLNGASVATDASGTIPSGIDRMDIGNEYGVTRFHNGHIARLRYFNKRLPNATLQLLSEPDPTLNLQFALNKTLTPVAGPAPSFSRASTGTYFNASGVLTSASINTPRFDHVYSGGQWVSKGLLVEEQRTNGFLQSNGFGNSPWSIALSRGTVTQNAASPDGTNNAWGAECTVTSPGGFYLVQSGLSSPSATYTFSFFAKKDNNGFVAIEAGETSNDVYVFFDLTNGLSGNLSSVGGYTNISHGLSDCGNGWYRCRLTFTKSNSNNLTGYIYPTCNSFSSLSCTSGQRNFIFGAQYETGSFATSYIPTTTSSVTRSADVCQITGTSFNWMWNQGEGSVVAEYDRLFPASSISNASTVFQAFIDGNNNDRYALFHNSSGTVGERFNVTVGNVEYANLDSGVSVSQPVGRASSAYKLNDFALTVNGGSIVSDTSGLVVSNADRLNLGRMYASNWLNGHIASIRYYPARLTNTKLQQLST